MDQPENGKPGRRGMTRRGRWLWATAAVALASALVAMYRYEKSLEDDLEAMLRASLQQFQAESAGPGASETAPDPDTAADRG